ncbi:hypothetical protein LUZ60_006119 [Juncus effusus]|nr:hypothetical protein LUZ60_006119 [Juncus effusus]
MAWESETIGPDVASAGLHVSERIARDVAATQLDLEESLEASRYASHPYTSHPKDWPALVEIGETRDLPSLLIERYNSVGEVTTLCGLFPEIHRAWASVDNSLFLWRHDKWDSQCREYNEEQPIISVGLARAKSGVFVEAIQYILIVATQVELILLGICCTSSSDGSDAYAELAIQPLPEYRIASDGCEAVCISSTESGRVFISARNGQIYELFYTNGSGWGKRFRSVCVTSSIFTRFLPNALTFGASDPIIQMVTDNERHILFARTESSKLQVYDLGQNGEGQLRKITESKTLIDPRDSSNPNRTTRTGTKPSICCIAPVSKTESKRVDLVAVLSDGKRLYLTTNGNNSSFGLTSQSQSQRPSCLRVVSTRPAPPLGPISSLAPAQRPDSLAVKADSAFYSIGTLILSDSSSGQADSALITVQRDSSQLTPQFGTSFYGTGTGTGTVRNPNSRALREIVSVSPGTGWMLCAADVAPSRETVSIVQSLYADVAPLKSDPFDPFGAPEALKLWAKGDLATQHILPKRKFVVFSNMGLTELAVNRPVDILKRLLERNVGTNQIHDFFIRYGTAESAAMCLMLASKLAFNEEEIVSLSNTICEKAAEAFENPILVGTATAQAGYGTGTGTGTRSPAGGFSMGQVVQEAGPVFSGQYEGLCLCASRLLVPVWEFPVMSVRGGNINKGIENRAELVRCRLESRAMRVLEGKIRDLEYFFRVRRDNKRGLYGTVVGTGTSGILYGTSGTRGSTSMSGSAKRQRPLYSSSELAAMEVRAIDCLRRLLRRSGEALYLLQIVSQHNVSRLAQQMDSDARQRLAQLSFRQLVCSDEGHQLAAALISNLMEYYVGPERTGSLDDISAKLREGCPSYFNESDLDFFLAVEHLEKAKSANRPEEKHKAAKDAFSFVKKVPDSVHLGNLCKRFEAVRFYEAVVILPLQKAKELASNPDSDPTQIHECYSIITNALRNLIQPQTLTLTLDEASRSQHMRQLIQLGLESTDSAFHEHLYKTLIELGLENELLQFGGPDLVDFLKNSSHSTREGNNIGLGTVKYLDLLAKYYVSKGQHREASQLLYRLAERQGSPTDGPTLQQRHQYLSNAILQAKTAGGLTQEGFLNILEDKLTVLGFQMRIKEALESIASKMSDGEEGTGGGVRLDGRVAKEKADELALNLKSITQLYNDYAMPFELYEACLEILNFAHYTGGADGRIVSETWARLLNQALSTGGVKEACSVLKRVGPKLYDGDGACLPLDSVCLHLEKAALERLTKGIELTGDDDVARALLATCHNAYEPVVSVYDKLLSNGAIVPSLSLKLRLFRSVLSVLRDWALTLTASGSVQSYSGAFWMDRTAVINQGVKDKIVTLSNKYMTEVRRLPLPQNQTEPVSLGFRELEEQLLNPSTSHSIF